MKQRWIFGILGVLITVIFLSCTGFFDQEEELIDFRVNSDRPSLTTVYFDNVGNNCSVDVFPSYLRDIKLLTVSPKYQTPDIGWKEAPNGTEFYYTYNITVSGASIPYTHPKGWVTAIIPKDQRTPIKIVALSDIVGTDETLFTESLISINNNSSLQIRLQRGNIAVNEMNGMSLIAYGQTALYKISLSAGDNISNYSILIIQGGERIALPMTALESGYLYEIRFYNTSSIPQFQSRKLTLSNLNL